MKTPVKLPFLVLTFALMGGANMAHGETLTDAVALTLSQHPQVESAIAAVNGAEERQKEQYSAYFPSLQVTAQAGRIFGDNSTSRGLSVTRGSGYSGLGEGSIAARQKIFDGYETRSRVSAAKAEAEAAEMSLRDVRENLALRVAQTYINLQRARKGLSMLKGQQKAVADYLTRISTLVDDGVADESELQQARDVSVILDNFIADYQGQVRLLESDYNELAGRFPEEDLEKPLLAENAIPQNADEAITRAKAIHPLLESAKLQSLSAKYDVRAEQSTYIPKFDGELSYLESDREDVIGGEVRDARAVVRMNWEFETGGGQKARIQQRKSELKAARARVLETEAQIERAVRQGYTELQTASRQMENQKRRHDLNKKLFDTYKVQFDGARISLLQLMQSDNQLLLTKLDTLNAQSRVQLAQYAILAAMGRLQNALNVDIAEHSHPRRNPE